MNAPLLLSVPTRSERPPRRGRLAWLALAAVCIAGPGGAAELPPTWDDTRVAAWSADFQDVVIPASGPGGPGQHAMWHVAPVAGLRPLVVSLHTWSGDYAQRDPLAELAAARGYNYIHPDFRGPNIRPEACGSELVVADIDAAIDYALKQGHVDPANIHLIGVSGGGHAAMLAWMRSRHEVSSFSAWVGVSDLVQWHAESAARGNRYAADLGRVTTGDPARFDAEEARKRSPLFMETPAARRQKSRLFLHVGVHDGYTGSVPITQTIAFYNKVVRDLAPAAQDALVPADITAALVRDQAWPVGGVGQPRHGDALYERQWGDRVQLTVFEGGHEMLPEKALEHIPLPARADVAAPRPEYFQFAHMHEMFLDRARVAPVGLLFLGDSITEAWWNVPDLWWQTFGAYQPANFGISGDRTQNVIWRLEHGELDRIKPRVVVLLIGTNNTADNTAAEILGAQKRILALIRARLPQTKVVMMALFPRGPRRSWDGTEDPWAQRMEVIRQVNAGLAGLVDGRTVFALDIGGRFLDATGRIPAELMPDQLHLSPSAYAIWAEALQPLVKTLMQE